MIGYKGLSYSSQHKAEEALPYLYISYLEVFITSDWESEGRKEGGRVWMVWFVLVTYSQLISAVLHTWHGTQLVCRTVGKMALYCMYL